MGGKNTRRRNTRRRNTRRRTNNRKNIYQRGGGTLDSEEKKDLLLRWVRDVNFMLAAIIVHDDNLKDKLAITEQLDELTNNKYVDQDTDSSFGQRTARER